MPGARSGKKGQTPPKTVAKKTKGQRYDYVELGKASLSSADEQHVYGVIIDATFPYKTNVNKYVCSLKIVDPSLNTGGSKGGDYASVVMYAKRFEDLPIVLRIGDVIRLHRASLRIYNNRRQFNLTMSWTSSWALFSTEKSPVVGASAGDFAPVLHSGSAPTIEKQDTTILTNLRKWSTGFFSGNDVLGKDMFTPLNRAKSQGADFDVVAKIVGIHEMDAYTNELKLRDGSGSTWYTMAIKLKFPHLRTGQVVRIRSATCDETSSNKQVLALSHYSNIMTVIGGSKLAGGLSKVSEDWKADSAELSKDVPSVAVTVSDVERKWAGLQQTSLEELFTSKTLQGDTFRTTFCVTRVEPGDLKEAVKSYSKKTKTASSAKGAKGGELIWQVQLCVKDVSTLSNANTYRILNYSHEGLGGNFFGKLANMHTDAGAHKKLEKQVGTLLKFNAWVDAVVERRNGWYYIKDTKLRC